MLALLVEVGKVVELGDDAIDAGAHEAGGAQFLENMQVFALARTHHRRQQHQLAALRHGQYRIHHLAHCLRLQAFAVLGAAWLADPRIEQAQIVIDLGNGAHGRAGVV